MTKKALIIVLLTFLAALHCSAQTALTARYFDCVTGCGTANSLDKYSGLTPILAIVAGYYVPADSGGGQYISNNPCPDILSGASGTFSAGSTEINPVSGTTGAVVGSIIVAPGFVPAGTEISAVPSGKLELTEPALTSGSTSFTIAGPNGGTLIRTNSGICFYKADYRGDPHEFGAYGDGNAHGGSGDTVAMQNWLGAYGMVSNPAAISAPANFGPWIASVPATYLVYQPLVCPPYANLQAGANISATQPGNGAGPPNPLVMIEAAQPSGSPALPSLQNTLAQPALIMASQYCRISGIAINVNGNGGPGYYFPNLPGSAGSSTTTTVSLSSAAPSGVVPGTPLSDTGGCIPSGAVITAVNNGSTPPNLTISVPATGSCGTDYITITGFYAVDVVGTHVGIDNHSLIKQGYQNIRCGDTVVDGMQVKDAQIVNAQNDGIHLAGGCSNTRVINDVIQNSGLDGMGTGIVASGKDLSLEGGVVEDSGGPDVLLNGADLVSITGMAIDGSGQGVSGSTGTGDAGIQITGSTNVTINGNRITNSGGDSLPGTPQGAQIRFAGTSDNISIGTNTYISKTGGSDANFHAPYIYDVTAPVTLTNTHIYETPAQPPVATFTTAAQPILQPLMVPQFTNNQIGGLTMSNDIGTPATKIDIAAGSAADSTNSTIIQLPQGCTVNLANPGANGLDTSSVQPSTTYFVYVIAAAAAGGVVTPSCMASTSPVAPLFTDSSFTGSGYVLRTQGGSISGGTTVYNVQNLAGASVGDAVWDSSDFSTPNTMISGFTANAQPSGTATGSWTGVGPNTVINCYPAGCTFPSGIFQGMAIQGNGCIPSGAYVVSSTTTTITVSNIPTSCSSPDSTLSISGARQTVLNNGANHTKANANLSIATAYYRMIGALYTTSAGTPTLVSFTQEGDTFYLAEPSLDVTAAVGTAPYPLVLPSLPNGIRVKAFGRCVGGPYHVIVYSPGQKALAPATSFLTAPGFDVNSVATPTTFPFSAWTSTGQSLLATSDAPGTAQISCMTDGWMWPRG